MEPAQPLHRRDPARADRPRGGGTGAAEPHDLGRRQRRRARRRGRLLPAGRRRGPRHARRGRRDGPGHARRCRDGAVRLRRVGAEADGRLRAPEKAMSAEDDRRQRRGRGGQGARRRRGRGRWLPRPAARPGLATILVGDDPASHVYVGWKRKDCEEVGMASIHHELPGDVDQAELTQLIQELNAEPTVNGMILQLPVPDHLDGDTLTALVDPGEGRGRPDPGQRGPSDEGASGPGFLHAARGDRAAGPRGDRARGSRGCGGRALRAGGQARGGRSCWAATQRSPPATRARATWRRSAAGRMSWWRPSASLG